VLVVVLAIDLVSTSLPVTLAVAFPPFRITFTISCLLLPLKPSEDVSSNAF